MSDDPDMMNSHFPTDDNPRFIRPDVEFRQVKPGGPSQLHLDGELVRYPVLRESISVQRLGSMNILTLSIVVGKVDMGAKPPRPDSG